MFTAKDKPQISVVIINKNERGVGGTLSGLQRQTIDLPFEILIVDASNGVLDSIYSMFSNVRTIHFSSKTDKKITIPEQRNAGIKNAKGAVVAFIDAACKPSKNWLKNVTSPIVNGGELIVAGGTLSEGRRTFHDNVYEQLKNTKYIKQAPTINLAIHKDVFKRVGYFDENLLYGSDMDFTWRVNAAGIKILNARNAMITHDWGTIKQELKRGYRYGQAKIRLYRKHRMGAFAFVKREATLVVYSLFLILLPLVLVWPYYLLLLLIPLAKNFTTREGHALTLINLTTAAGALLEVGRNGLRRLGS